MQSDQITQNNVHANRFQLGWMSHHAATTGMGKANAIGRTIQRRQKNLALAGSPKATFRKIPIMTRPRVPPLTIGRGAVGRGSNPGSRMPALA
jgi:hypothetical protein